jgi:hypothetical protein
VTRPREVTLQLQVTLTAERRVGGALWRTTATIYPDTAGSSAGFSLRTAGMRALDAALVAWDAEQEARHG